MSVINKSFPLICNDAAAATVSDALRSNRLPHAIIIEGGDGLGKHTLADYIAKGAVCGEADKPCGFCRGCHLAEVGSHPDITKAKPEQNKKNITVDVVRAIRSEAYLKPNMANRRVFVIDPADSMNEAAQNALLKVLEEPPANALFILIARSAASLLPTVRSRCITLSLAPAEVEDAVHWILSSRKDYTSDAVFEAVQLSNGNIGEALRILEGGAGIPEDAKKLMELILKRDTYGLMKAFRAYEKDRPAATELFLRLGQQTARTLSDTVRGINTGFTEIKLNAVYSLCCRCEESLALNINLPLLFTGFCAEVSKL